MKITIDIPELSIQELKDILYTLESQKLTKIFEKNPEYRTSIKKACTIFSRIQEGIEAEEQYNAERKHHGE